MTVKRKPASEDCPPSDKGRHDESPWQLGEHPEAVADIKRHARQIIRKADELSDGGTQPPPRGAEDDPAAAEGSPPRQRRPSQAPQPPAPPCAPARIYEIQEICVGREFYGEGWDCRLFIIAKDGSEEIIYEPDGGERRVLVGLCHLRLAHRRAFGDGLGNGQWDPVLTHANVVNLWEDNGTAEGISQATIERTARMRIATLKKHLRRNGIWIRHLLINVRGKGWKLLPNMKITPATNGKGLPCGDASVNVRAPGSLGMPDPVTYTAVSNDDPGRKLHDKESWDRIREVLRENNVPDTVYQILDLLRRKWRRHDVADRLGTDVDTIDALLTDLASQPALTKLLRDIVEGNGGLPGA